MTRAFVLGSILAAAMSTSALAAPVDPNSEEGVAIRAKIAHIDSVIEEYRRAGRRVPDVSPQGAVSSGPLFMRLSRMSTLGPYAYGNYYPYSGYAINGDRSFGTIWGASGYFPTFYSGTGVAGSSGSSFRLRSLVNRRAYLESRLAPGSIRN